MKIVSVHAHPLRTPLDTPFAFSQGWVRARSATLVEIRTDDGLVGWGEAFCQGLETPEISTIVIRDCLADMLVGENPLDTERLWFAMYNRTRDFGRKGAVMAAISGIDTALWDIAGKAYGKPMQRHSRMNREQADAFKKEEDTLEVLKRTLRMERDLGLRIKDF